MPRLTFVLMILIACGCADHGLTNNSTPTVDRIKSVLENDLRGIPWGEFEERLGIREVVFDQTYTNQPGHSRRLYHLDGFYIDVSVEHRGNELFTDSHFFPGVGEDGLSREQRMEAYEVALAEHFEERQSRLDSQRKKNADSTGTDPFDEF